MTPLEEIEQAIEYVRASGEATPLQNIDLLGPLYQARAIAHLEATISDIGVTFQTYAAETLPLMRRMADIAAPPPDPNNWGIASWDAPHPFTSGGLRGECRCMRPRADPIHDPPRPEAQACYYCGMPLGQQHRPSRSRQGTVSKESVATARHAFYNANAEATVCGYCGKPRGDAIHYDAVHYREPRL